MINPKGFLQYKKELPASRSVAERIQDFNEIYLPFPEEKTMKQAERCMDCGVPFCHNGCPLGNLIPEFNEAVQMNQWERAFQILSSTNNFPEFTGRICPAPCESACVLGINQPAVSIEHIEKTIAEKAFEMGWIKPNPPKHRTGKKVAVIGSGPAGLAAADMLNKAGHNVTVFEKNDRLGGLLRYGIPDFKLEKWTIDRRLAILEEEGIEFKSNCEVGKSISSQELYEQFDAIVLAMGALVPRDLSVEGRMLKGIFPAMDYLEQSNRIVAGEIIDSNQLINAKGKHVVVIGGGDTGSDCIGTANRQQAASVSQLNYHIIPSSERPQHTPWPMVPATLQTSSSQEEGCERIWEVQTKGFVGDENGQIKAIKLCKVKWDKNANTGKYGMKEIEGSEFEIPCDLAFVAIGYKQTEYSDFLKSWEVKISEKGLIAADSHQTNQKKIFTCGDARRGQSLVVWAIAEGRDCALEVNDFLEQ